MAWNLCQVLRSFPHLVAIYQDNIQTLSHGSVLALIMADGGYFDQLHHDDSGYLKTVVGLLEEESGCFKAIISPMLLRSYATDAEREQTQLLHRLEIMMEQ